MQPESGGTGRELVGDGFRTGRAWASRVGEAVTETAEGQPDPGSIVIDTSVPHSARRYDYWLGGKTNYAPDRASGDAIEAAFPDTRVAVLENRKFLRRVVTLLAGERGIDQFLDVGTGIPSPGNTHEVAQGLRPASRVVYADNDPVVLAHSRALLSGTAQGRTAYLQADLRDPEAILAHPDLGATLDLRRPVALLLISVLPFLPDDDRPHDVVAALVGALPPGSYLAISHGSYDAVPERAAEFERVATADRSAAFWARPRAEVERLFAGLELLEPGVVPVNRWRAEGEPEPRPTDAQVLNYGGVARIP